MVQHERKGKKNEENSSALTDLKAKVFTCLSWFSCCLRAVGVWDCARALRARREAEGVPF